MEDARNEIPLQEVVYKATDQDKISTVLKPETKYNKINLFLYLIAAIANLLSFATGASIVWITPVLPKLDGSQGMDENPFGRAITASEVAWIAGLGPLGGTCGPIVVKKISDRLGRKKTLLLTAFLHIASLLITVFAKEIYLYYISRVLAGLGTGIVYTILPVYLTEISENHNRGALGCSVSIFVVAGVNFALIIGPYLTIQMFSLICICPLLFFIPIFYVLSPETPLYLASINDVKNLTQSLLKLRNKTTEEINLEMTTILETVQESKVRGHIKDVFQIKHLRRGIIISFGLGILQQAIGYLSILSYMPSIFRESKTNLAPELCVMIVGTCQLLGTVLSSVIVDRLGRKILLLASSTGVCTTLVSLGVYFYLKINQYQIEKISWLPLVSVGFYIVFYGIGLGPVPWVVLSELFPANLKSMVVTVISFTSFLTSFIVTVTFPSLTLWIGMENCFFMYSIVSLAGCIFIYLVLVETKGKSFQQIQIMLQGK